MVDLDRAAAIASAGDRERALGLVDRLGLGGYQYLHSTRAELLRPLGRTGDARAAYRAALELAVAAHERRILQRRLDEIDARR